MMQGISLCDHVTERGVFGLRNLVTERAVIGQYDLIVERERYHSRNLLTERDSGFPREFQATLSHEQAPQVHVTASLIR